MSLQSAPIAATPEVPLSDGAHHASGIGFPQALPVARILHWTMALCVLFLFVFGILMTQLGAGPVANWLYSAHKSLGILVLALLVLRLIHRIAMTVSGRWGGVGMRPVHWLMYAVTGTVALLGWAAVSDFGARGLFFGLSLPPILPEGSGRSEWLFPAHAWLAFGLVALVFAHIGLAVGDYLNRKAHAQ